MTYITKGKATIFLKSYKIITNNAHNNKKCKQIVISKLKTID